MRKMHTIKTYMMFGKRREGKEICELLLQKTVNCTILDYPIKYSTVYCLAYLSLGLFSEHYYISTVVYNNIYICLISFSNFCF